MFIESVDVQLHTHEDHEPGTLNAQRLTLNIQLEPELKVEG